MQSVFKHVWNIIGHHCMWRFIYVEKSVAGPFSLCSMKSQCMHHTLVHGHSVVSSQGQRWPSSEHWPYGWYTPRDAIVTLKISLCQPESLFSEFCLFRSQVAAPSSLPSSVSVLGGITAALSSYSIFTRNPHPHPECHLHLCFSVEPAESNLQFF